MDGRSWRDFDFWLLGAVVALIIFGVAMIRSAVAGNETLADLPTRQIIFALVGFIVLLGTAALDYRLWVTFGRVLYVLTVGLLIMVFVTSRARFGSARWLEVGLITVQPSELAKIVLILLLADFFARNQHKVHNLGWMVRSLVITFSLVVWIILQPDLSTSIVLLVLWFALIWASGLDVRYVLGMAGAGLFVGLVGFPLYLLNYDPTNESNLIKPYQIERILNFLFPQENARYGANYNVQQALIAIGNGGWTGQGYGHGPEVQLRFLKVRHTDFIFAALTEEFGFVGAALVLGLIAFVIWRCLKVAHDSPDLYGALIAYGVATLIFFHTAVNVGMNLNLLPVTGLPLPFVSYGGSTLVTLMLGIGLVESVALRRKTLEF